jgi:transposase InsO family protein
VTHRRDCTGSEEGRRPGRDWLRERFADCEITLSHGRTSQCWDNALAESSFASIKGELLDLQPWLTRAAARRAVVEYIAWYNGTRLHSTLGYRSPPEYEEDGKIKNVA